MSTLMIKHFSSTINDDILKAYFQIFGKIVSSVVIRDNKNSKNFAYLTFEERASAKKAIECFNGKADLGATSLYVGYARTGQKGQTSFGGGNIFIKNLDPSINEERLEAEFSLFGEIESVKILRDKENKSKCRAFVCFKSIEDATKAIIVMNKKKIRNRIIYLEFAKSVNQHDSMFRATSVKQMLDSTYQLQSKNNTFSSMLACNTPGFPMPFMNMATGTGLNHNRFAASTATIKPNKKRVRNKKRQSLNKSLQNLSTRDNNSSSDEENKDDEDEDEQNKEVDEAIESNLFSGILKELPEPEQKKLLRQLLLPQIERLYPRNGEKFLNILIRLKVNELIKMFEDSRLMQAKVLGIINMMKSRAESCTAKSINNSEAENTEDENISGAENTETENTETENTETENTEAENTEAIASTSTNLETTFF